MNLLAILTIAFSFSLASSASAETLLTLSPTEGPAIELSRADLEALAPQDLRTTSEWTSGLAHFRGPSARDVLSLADLEDAQTLRAIAANDYAVDIPVSALIDYDAVFAMALNGEPLSLRDKGPIWIVFPRDAHETLKDPAYNAYWVWQLVRLEQQ